MLKVDQLVGRLSDAFEVRAAFEVADRERLVLTGPSGCGKTTLLRLIAGLAEPEAGRLELGGRALQSVPTWQREIGFVFQSPAFFPDLDVEGNATFGLRMRGVAAPERRARAREWLERVGLGAHADRSVETLSGGEKQRLAFVRAMIWEPKLVLLDEPFGALDAGMRTSLREELLRLHLLAPVPLILVTHDREDVVAIATRELGFRRVGGAGVWEVGGPSE